MRHGRRAWRARADHLAPALPVCFPSPSVRPWRARSVHAPPPSHPRATPLPPTPGARDVHLTHSLDLLAEAFRNPELHALRMAAYIKSRGGRLRPAPAIRPDAETCLIVSDLVSNLPPAAAYQGSPAPGFRAGRSSFAPRTNISVSPAQAGAANPALFRLRGFHQNTLCLQRAQHIARHPGFCVRNLVFTLQFEPKGQDKCF
ncbi:MAG: hypothetical protein ACI9NG_000735 [Hyphomonas sp.]|jgi:hypothetical protein